MAQVSGALDKQTRLVINHITKKEELIPAIDRIHMIERGCVTYTPPPISVLSSDSYDYQASLDEYLERLELCFLDLKWLLSLNYQHFWCQIIYDTTCRDLIDSYLKLAPRPHDILKLKTLPDKIIQLQNDIHKSVFLVCLRMSTFKETSKDFMNADAFANIIYNYYLFDIPKIFDLCVLYKKNPVLVKMIENLFRTQSNYFNDFKMCIKDILSAFEKSKQNLRKLFDLDSIYYTPDIVREKNTSVYTTIKENLTAIIELIYYLTDFSITISDLTSIQTELYKYLSDQKFEYHIKDLMEHTLFPVEDILKKMHSNETDIESQAISSLVLLKLKTLKYQQTKLFKEIVESNSVKPLISNIDNPIFSQDQIRVQEQECVDYFVQICCDIMEEKRFLCYYEEKFSMTEQINLVRQLTDNKIDEMTSRFLFENLKSCVQLYSRKKSVRARFGAKSSDFVKKNVKRVDGSAAAAASGFDDDELEGLVQSVLDLLPGTDKELIKKCLKYYNRNAEQVINAFLENNLPEFPVEEIETTAMATSYMKLDDEDNDYVTSKVTKKLTELDLRKNVYDGDEFDVFKKPEVDMSKVYLGKKGEIESFDLDKREGIDREFYKNYDHIMYERECKEMGLDPVKNELVEYEDEYDDTYDAVTNANDDVEPESFIKPLNQKLGLKKRDQFEEDEEEESEGQEIIQNTASARNQTGQQSQHRQPQGGGQHRSTNNPQTSQYSRGHNVQQHQQQSQPQQKQPLPQRVPKNRSQQNYSGQQPSKDTYQDQQQFSQSNKFQQRDSGLELKSQNLSSQPAKPAKTQFSDGFQSKYAKPSSNNANESKQHESNTPRESIDRETSQGESGAGSAKTAEQIKRERKWKNDNKNKHRKDQAARKGNLL